MWKKNTIFQSHRNKLYLETMDMHETQFRRQQGLAFRGGTGQSELYYLYNLHSLIQAIV